MDAKEGYLITVSDGSWIQIRLWNRQDGWLDHGGGWVPTSQVAEVVPYEYPNGTVIAPEFPDHIYPERYPVELGIDFPPW